MLTVVSSLQAAVTKAAVAISNSGLSQLEMVVVTWPGFIVLNLFVTRTVKGLEHQRRE